VKRKNIVQILIFLLGFILILLAIFFTSTPAGNSDTSISINTILLSIGCSIISVVIINFVEYHITLPEVNVLKFIDSWKLVAIYDTRQAMNAETNKLLEKAEELDIAAFGCKGLINYQGDVLKNRLRKGMKIRFLVPDKDSDFIKQREVDEKATLGEIKKTIEDLILWIKDVRTTLNLADDQIEIKKYSCLPLDSIMRIDSELFTGPFMVKKVSQLTMAYQYRSGGRGYTYYSNYFNEIWNDSSISSYVSGTK
jgi:hypothetical protein